MNPKVAAAHDYISEIIEPAQTREYVADSLNFLENKRQSSVPAKKHGNIPL